MEVALPESAREAGARACPRGGEFEKSPQREIGLLQLRRFFALSEDDARACAADGVPRSRARACAPGARGSKIRRAARLPEGPTSRRAARGRAPSAPRACAGCAPGASPPSEG